MLGHLTLNQVQLLSTRALVSWFALACVAGCAAAGDDSPPSPNDHEPSSKGSRAEPHASAAEPAAPPKESDSASDDAAGAMAHAYAELHAANYDALPDVIARLDAELERDPTQGRVAFYAGVMRLWRATGGPRQLREMFTDATQAIELLEKARELRPEDPHVGAFLGVAHVTFANVSGDEERIRKGRQILEETVPLYPAYANGVLAQALGMLPREHPFFADAIAAVRASYEACGTTSSAFEPLTFGYPGDSKQGACANVGIVAHVWEGYSLVVGDIFVKAGDTDRARRMYDNVKLSPTYARWPFKAELERRIADADARKALYLDGMKDNDPTTWMQEQSLCVGCHADEP